MRVLNKKEMVQLMDEFQDGGIVFSEYKYHAITPELMVTDGFFGARCVVPQDGRVLDFDWNIEEYNDGDEFAVFDNEDVLQMIQTLTSGLKMNLI